MRFSQLDRITELVEGDRITAVKGLTLAEEYLQDHFPRFPVMPGVLMLEAMFQASMFLVLYSDDFKYSTAALAEANQVKFGDFVEPGNQLTVTAVIQSMDDSSATLKTSGTIDEKVAVRARLVLDKFDLAPRGLASAEIDEYLRDCYRKQFRKLQDPRLLAQAEAGERNLAAAPQR